MPLFYFRIGSGDYSGTSGEGFDLADKDAAWAEMCRVCGDLVGGIARKLKQQTEWRMELLDESRTPMFRIRVLAETLYHSAEVGEAHGIDLGVKTSRSGDLSIPDPTAAAPPNVSATASPDE